MAKGKGSAGRGGGGGRSGGNSAASAGGATGLAALTIDNLRDIYSDVRSESGRASIADLRTEFYNRFDPAGRTSTDTFDNFLKEEQFAGRLTLIPKNDPQGITDRDRRNAIDFFGSPRHLVYFR